MSREATQFKPGNPGGPGAPKSGRRITLELMDAMLSKLKNKELFSKAIQEEFEKNPMAFFKKYVMPLLPKDINLNFDGNIDIDLTRLSDAELNRAIELAGKLRGIGTGKSQT